MRRYDYDDEEDQDDNLFRDTDDDDDDDGDEEIVMDSAEYADMMRRQEALTLMQLELVQLDLNQRLLFRAVKIVKKNTWFYSFRSRKTQLKMIAETYQFLQRLIVMQNEGKS